MPKLSDLGDQMRPVHAESPGDFLHRPAATCLRQQNKTIHNRGFMELGRRARARRRVHGLLPSTFARKMA